MPPIKAHRDEPPAAVRLDAEAWEHIHSVTTGIFAVSSIAISFWRPNSDVILPVVLYSALCVAMLVLSRMMRTLLADLFGQFHYREKFLLILLNLGAMGVPSLIGLHGVGHAFSVLLVLLCLQSIDSISYGRLYAVGSLLAFSNMMGADLPPFSLVSIWTLALLIAIRAEHVRFLLEKHGHGPGVRLSDALGESFLPVFGAWGLGVVVYAAAGRLLEGERRRLVWGQPLRGDTMTTTSTAAANLLVDALLLAFVIVVAIVLLHWVDGKFRRKRRGDTEEEGAVTSVAEERRDVAPTSISEPALDESADARGRLLARFRALALTLARREDETPREFLLRIARDMLANDPLPEPMNATLDRAAYSRLPIADNEAAEIIGKLDAVETSAQAAQEKIGNRDKGRGTRDEGRDEQH